MSNYWTTQVLPTIIERRAEGYETAYFTALNSDTLRGMGEYAKQQGYNAQVFTEPYGPAVLCISWRI